MSMQGINPEYLETAKRVRESFGEGDAARDAGLVRPDDVAWEDDIAYGPDEKWNLLDIYYPKETEGLLPAIVSIHGGGWIYGTKEVYQYYGCSLAEHGFAVVNFNYRLAPEHPFPAALEDVNRVFTWIREHGREHHIDPEKLFAVGDSAGAQLCSQYMAMLTNPEFAACYDFTLPKVRVLAVGLNCGCYDITSRETEDGILQAYFGGDPAEFAPRVDTMAYLNAQFPPAFVMTACHDFLRSAAEPMKEALQAHGVEAEYHLYGTEDQKEIGHVFHCNVRLEEAKKCNDDECAFFKKHLG